MTAENKAREYANETLIMSNYPHIWQSGYDGYIAGYNSRDAEVAELKAQIKELTDILDSDRFPQPQSMEAQNERLKRKEQAILNAHTILSK